MQTPEFLEISDVLDIYNFLVNKFGGTLGVRDEGLLESAVSQPKATFFGELLHPTIHQQAVENYLINELEKWVLPERRHCQQGRRNDKRYTV